VEAPGTAPPGEGSPLSEITLDANVMSVMLEAARRADELNRIQKGIPDLRLVPERTGPAAIPPDPDLDRATVEALLPLIDGERSVERLIQDSLFPKFTVLRILYALLQKGMIRLRERKGSGTLRRVGPPAAGRRILLLSDLPNFRTALSVCLRSAGYEVLEGHSSGDLADLVSRNPVDAILLDTSVEADGGAALCARLRNLTRTPFLVLTGNTRRPAVLGAIQSGARHVLVKPVREDLLLDRLSNVLKG